MRAHQTAKNQRRRSGTVLAEMAVVMPVFFVMVIALFEFGHAYLAVNVLNAAANRAARIGAVEGATDSDVMTAANDIINTGLPAGTATVSIKNGDIFDQGSSAEIASLPDLNMADCEPRQLFIVHVTVDYEDIGIMGPRWLTGLKLHGEAVMRHE